MQRRTFEDRKKCVFALNNKQIPTKTMKKILSLAVLLMAVLGFTACSNDDEEQTYSLTGKRFLVEQDDRTEMIDEDGDSVIITVSRSIQFLDENTAILVCTLEDDYPEYPEYYIKAYCYGYMECQFNGLAGKLSITKMTTIMTGYYDEKMTSYYETPIVWNVKKDEKGKGLLLVESQGSERMMESIEPIKDLKWQEFPPMDDDLVQMIPNPMGDYMEVRLPSVPPTSNHRR